MPGLVNGVPDPLVNVSDRGFQYGDGVFSTLPFCAGLPLFLDRHMARLAHDCAALSIPFPGSTILADEAFRLCADEDRGVLKIQVTRGAGGRGYRSPEHPSPTRVLTRHPRPDYSPRLMREGVAVRTCSTRLGINPSLAGIKHMNRLEQVLARSEWSDADIFEGLMFDGDGFLVEGTMTNLFLMRGNQLRTPRLDRCGVAGVMRGIVLDWAKGQGLSIDEARISPDELIGADELFLTNCVIGAFSVTRCDYRVLSVGPVATAFREWLNAEERRQVERRCTG